MTCALEVQDETKSEAKSEERKAKSGKRTRRSGGVGSVQVPRGEMKIRRRS